MKINEMQSRQARNELTAILTRAREHGEATIVTHYNRPCAIVVPIDWYEAAQAALTERSQRTNG